MGLVSSICDFFSGLFSSDSANTSSNNDGLTGVERYIRAQTETASSLTSVERYIRAQADTATLTSVERYIRAQG